MLSVSVDCIVVVYVVAVHNVETASKNVDLEQDSALAIVVDQDAFDVLGVASADDVVVAVAVVGDIVVAADGTAAVAVESIVDDAVVLDGDARHKVDNLEDDDNRHVLEVVHVVAAGKHWDSHEHLQDYLGEDKVALLVVVVEVVAEA